MLATIGRAIQKRKSLNKKHTMLVYVMLCIYMLVYDRHKLYILPMNKLQWDMYDKSNELYTIFFSFNYSPHREEIKGRRIYREISVLSHSVPYFYRYSKYIMFSTSRFVLNFYPTLNWKCKQFLLLHYKNSKVNVKFKWH